MYMEVFLVFKNLVDSEMIINFWDKYCEHKNNINVVNKLEFESKINLNDEKRSCFLISSVRYNSCQIYYYKKEIEWTFGKTKL